MWKIIDQLYLGTGHDAANLPSLIAVGVSHVLNCTGEVPCHFDTTFQYLRLNISSDRFAGQLEEACAFIDQGRTAGSVLVHCVQARERSPAAIIAYLCHQGHSVDAALRLLSEATQDRWGDFRPPPSGLMRTIAERFESA